MGKTMGKGYDSPQHTVVLSSDYYMCKYEVTRSLWYAIMNDSIVTEEGMLPMTHITWNDAEAFTKKLNKLTLVYIFPSLRRHNGNMQPPEAKAILMPVQTTFVM